MEFKDTWCELREVTAPLKQLMKKPNQGAAIRQINELALQMEDSEWGGHANICHSELASIHAKNGDKNDERKELQKCASRMAKAACDPVHSKSVVRGPRISDKETKYWEAIKRFCNIPSYRSGGLLAIEAAKHFMETGHITASIRFANAGVKLLKDDRELIINALTLCREGYLMIQDYKNLLAIQDTMWAHAMLFCSETPLGRVMLLEAEVVTVLISQLVEVRQGRHSVLKSMYSQPLECDESGTPVLYEDSSLNSYQFRSLQTTVDLMTGGQNQLAATTFERYKLRYTDFCVKVFNIVNEQCQKKYFSI